jgi:hypothetical protein
MEPLTCLALAYTPVCIKSLLLLQSSISSGARAPEISDIFNGFLSENLFDILQLSIYLRLKIIFARTGKNSAQRANIRNNGV